MNNMAKYGAVKRFKRAFNRDKILYAIIALPAIYYIIFCYIPLYGLTLSFLEVRVFRGFSSFATAKNVGFKYFVQYLTDPYFWLVTRNTLIISVYSLIFSFPMPIIFALLLNELEHDRFKKVIQTVTYLPHFISTVVICGMIRSFFATDGIVNSLLNALGIDSITFLSSPSMFRPIYIGTGIWQSFGWNSIIYLAALTSIDTQLYEAAKLDGATRMQQIRYVSVPGILPTVSILLIMQLGRVLNVGYEKILLLYNGATMEVADVISTYVYRRGILDAKFSYGTAVGLFTAVINLILLVGANTISRKISETSLW